MPRARKLSIGYMHRNYILGMQKKEKSFNDDLKSFTSLILSSLKLMLFL